MKYAIVDHKKSEALPKLKGTCTHCGAELIAKCGRVKVWHWAHKSKLMCDPWWENETEWHRDWKNNFPAEWQEISAENPVTGERHIADVKNPYGLVIEFQHSMLSYEERASRESFYGNMIWVVDGTRGSSDRSYFNMGLSRNPLQEDPLAHAVEWWGRGKFLEFWAESSVKVFLDFGGEVLWRLLFFNKEVGRGAVAPLPRATLIENCLSGTKISTVSLKEEFRKKT